MTPRLNVTEMRLAAACAWLPASDAGREEQAGSLEPLLRGDISPQRFLDLVRRHRIEVIAETCLATHGLSAHLADLGSALSNENLRRRQRQLRNAKVEADVRRGLHDAGIPCAILKGASLSHRIYGDPLLRTSKDIDLLVHPKRLWDAVACLESAGWAESHPRFERSAAYRRFLERNWFHFEFRHPSSRCSLELHWHVEPHSGSHFEPEWLRSLIGTPPSAPLSPGEFLYLCAHGEHHAWARLKWLGDVRSILDRNPRIWKDAREFAPRVGMHLVLDQVSSLLEILHSAGLADHSVRWRTDRTTDFALLSISQDQLIPSRWEPGLKYWLQYHLYKAVLIARYPLRERLRIVASGVFLNPGDALLLKLPGKRLWALPLMRAWVMLLQLLSPRFRRKVRETYTAH